MGFSPVRYDPGTRTLTPRASYEKEKYNTLYVRDGDLVQSRVEAGPAVRVLGRDV
jgi:hypothetical protein